MSHPILPMFQALSDQIEEVLANIETTQAVLELTLDNERNRIARLELLLSMAGLSVGSMSAVSGFFGMNLLSGVESAAGLFLLVTGTSILLTGSLFVMPFTIEHVQPQGAVTAIAGPVPRIKPLLTAQVSARVLE